MIYHSSLQAVSPVQQWLYTKGKSKNPVLFHL